eukprot:1010537-Pelagomonas_calceolata.AAC.1
MGEIPGDESTKGASSSGRSQEAPDAGESRMSKSPCMIILTSLLPYAFSLRAANFNSQRMHRMPAQGKCAPRLCAEHFAEPYNAGDMSAAAPYAGLFLTNLLEEKAFSALLGCSNLPGSQLPPIMHSRFTIPLLAPCLSPPSSCPTLCMCGWGSHSGSGLSSTAGAPGTSSSTQQVRPSQWEPLFHCRIVRTSRGGTGLLHRAWPGPWRVYEAPAACNQQPGALQQQLYWGSR